MNGEELKREIRNAYYNDDMYSRYDLVDAVEDIVDENAKLRELVRDLYEMAYPECPSAFEAAFADRMRELGVDG